MGVCASPTEAGAVSMIRLCSALLFLACACVHSAASGVRRHRRVASRVSRCDAAIASILASASACPTPRASRVDCRCVWPPVDRTHRSGEETSRAETQT